ncbi:FlaD/FlaE family flagellar protein [Halobaculum sp. MBLA0147]|uniref:FlaD/FlaE family flagellar protein n=1 Tax=Halobaculum sp. MBLA0147 TaxID=3079934 RepID=UPI0035260D43
MLDPKDYDPEELRTLAGAASPTADPSDESRRWAKPVDFLGQAEARVMAAQLGDVYYLQAAQGGAERPYLPSMPEVGPGARLALDWLQFLVTVGGHDRAEEALEYYERIQWLGPDAAETLTDLLPGLGVGGDDPFEPSHHRTSLLFVARLAALR